MINRMKSNTFHDSLSFISYFLLFSLLSLSCVQINLFLPLLILISFVPFMTLINFLIWTDYPLFCDARENWQGQGPAREPRRKRCIFSIFYFFFFIFIYLKYWWFILFTFWTSDSNLLFFLIMLSTSFFFSLLCLELMIRLYWFLFLFLSFSYV